MSYNRWSLKEILKNFFFEHLGKIIVMVIVVVFVIPAFPDQSHNAFEGINEIGSSLVSLAVARREFILGFILTLLLTYFKDSLRSSREARWAGRALRSEINILRFRAKHHVEKIERMKTPYDDYLLRDVPFEQRYDHLLLEIGGDLERKKGVLVDTKLFNGTDYMPFFKACASKISMLRFRYILQGDDITRLSARLHHFIIDYDAIYTRLISEGEKSCQALQNEKDSGKRRDIVKDYMFHLNNYCEEVSGFVGSCEMLSGVLEGA